MNPNRKIKAKGIKKNSVNRFAIPTLVDKSTYKRFCEKSMKLGISNAALVRLILTNAKLDEIENVEMRIVTKSTKADAMLAARKDGK